VKIAYVPRAAQALDGAPAAVRKAFAKQADLLRENFRHPSLRAKKFDLPNQVWQGRVNRDWRFYFKILDNEYLILDITPHPK
jgi:hypothetical protein